LAGCDYKFEFNFPVCPLLNLGKKFRMPLVANWWTKPVGYISLGATLKWLGIYWATEGSDFALIVGWFPGLFVGNYKFLCNLFTSEVCALSTFVGLAYDFFANWMRVILPCFNFWCSEAPDLLLNNLPQKQSNLPSSNMTGSGHCG
jgi:hypothetical protein